MVEQRAFAQKLGSDTVIDERHRIKEEEDSWEFKGLVATKDVAASGVCGNLREVQHVCMKEGDAVPTTVIKVVEVACGDTETRRKKAKLTGWKTYLQARVVQARAARFTLHGSMKLRSVREHF